MTRWSAHLRDIRRRQHINNEDESIIILSRDMEIDKLKKEIDDLYEERADLYLKIEKFEKALRDIAAPTYGTELWMTEDEFYGIISGHYKNFQSIARGALKND